MTAAMAEGNLSDFGGALADDVVWWEIGSPEPVRGRDAVMERFSFVSDFDVSMDLHDVVANDDHLIALLDVAATRGDETFNYRTAEIMHLNADGEVSERWAFSDDTRAIIEFFG
jgi:ketosteroid isomerase-like protein